MTFLKFVLGSAPSPSREFGALKLGGMTLTLESGPKRKDTLKFFEVS